MKIIDREKYHNDINKLITMLDPTTFDCIVAIKRSGLILSVFISETYSKQIYVNTEIYDIPEIFKNVLLVDDKVCTGKTISKVKNKLTKYKKNVVTASLYIERDVETDYFIEKTNAIIKPYYENIPF